MNNYNEVRIETAEEKCPINCNTPIPTVCAEIHAALDDCISTLSAVQGSICGRGNEPDPEMAVKCLRDSLASMMAKARRATEIALDIRFQFGE